MQRVDQETENPMSYMKLEGRTLGQYQIVELLRMGSHTENYRAYQEALGREVLVRLLKRDLQTDVNYREAFFQSAAIHARLEHANIVPIHDYGSQDNLSYIVFRLMAGGTLQDRMKTGAIPLQEAAGVLKQIANALDFVHAQGFTHSDPSSANIVFDEWGSAYIGNFHVAGFQKVMPKTITGTAIYTAPEKWADKTILPASDQYALACVIYHAITGVFPFEKFFDLNSLAQKHINEMPASPQSYNPEIPLAVNDVLFRALAKKPEDRYPTVMDFAREFEKALQAVPQHVFISYSRRDKDYARQLSDYLSHNGFTVWIDDQIDYGDAWFREIDGAVKSCAAFVLLMSPDAEQSEWVHKEILLAKRYKKPIFPLLLAGDEFPIVIDIQFADVKDGRLPDTDFHRRLRRAVFGEG